MIRARPSTSPRSIAPQKKASSNKRRLCNDWCALLVKVTLF
jgi:hypothetical protein